MNTLPDHLLLQIFQYLGDSLVVAHVSSRWRRLVCYGGYGFWSIMELEMKRGVRFPDGDHPLTQLYMARSRPDKHITIVMNNAESFKVIDYVQSWFPSLENLYRGIRSADYYTTLHQWQRAIFWERCNPTVFFDGRVRIILSARL